MSNNWLNGKEINCCPKTRADGCGQGHNSEGCVCVCVCVCVSLGVIICPDVGSGFVYFAHLSRSKLYFLC
jgi:hypothetical protein